MHIPVAPPTAGEPGWGQSYQRAGSAAVQLFLPTHTPGRHREPFPEAGARAGGLRGRAEEGVCC